MASKRVDAIVTGRTNAGNGTNIVGNQAVAIPPDATRPRIDGYVEPRDASPVHVGDNNLGCIRPVKLAGSDGARIAPWESVKTGQRLTLNVSDDIVEGSTVLPVEPGR